MARKKTVKLTPEQEAAAQHRIDKMTSDELEQMAAFEKAFEQLPEEMQDLMLTFARQLEKMPEKKREKLVEAFDAFSNLMDGAEDGTDFEDDEYFEDDDDSGNGQFPHFLQSDNVQKYTLRVTLKGIRPAIYRKFSVPSNISLRLLSELIIELMGWEGSHLNQFRKGDDYYAPAYQREDELPVMFGPARNHNQEDVRLSDLLSIKGRTIEWEYDFGDSWCHEVRLSSVGDYADAEPLISFVEGKRACPPEDCGGIWGYEELLEIRERWIRYTLHAGRRPKADDLDRLEWYGMEGDFDPEEYDTDFAREICDDFCK